MDLLIGTSGFAYKEWIGTFYPKGLPSSGMLRHYGEHFRTVEINNTFYRMPSESVLRRWVEDVPEGFRFALKAPQLITHRKRLSDVGEPLAYFFRVARALEPCLGPVLFQLPPNLKKDPARLESFLALVPKETGLAIEFRHPSWLEGEVFELLRSHGAALCIAQGEDQETPLIATADWGYVRLRQVTYTDAALHDWARFIRAQTWSEAYVYFKHEEKGTGPTLARRLSRIFEDSAG